MAKPSHGAEVASNLVIVTHTLDRLGDGAPKAARDALATVRRWLAGETVTAEEMEAANAAAHATDPRHDQQQEWVCTAVGNLCFMARKTASWRDANRSILDAAVYATPYADNEEMHATFAALEAMRADALAKAPDTLAKLKAPKSSRPKPRPLDPQLEARIGALAFARLKKIRAKVAPDLQGDLAPLLEEYGYPNAAPFTAFEQLYGGIVSPERDWLCGSFACLTAGGHAAPRGGHDLVPVIATPNDVIYFLGTSGRGWAQDTIEDVEALPFADDMDHLVAKVLLFDTIDAKPHRVDLDDARGEAIAAAEKLPPVPEASDSHERFWGNEKTIVVEQARGTILASADAKLVARHR